MSEKQSKSVQMKERKSKIWSKLIYSRFLVILLMLALQAFLFVLFCVKLEPYTKYFFGVSIALSIIFIIYIVNKNGKNEFKITWILPVAVFPVFGIAAYWFLKANWGGLAFKKKVNNGRKITNSILSQTDESSKTFELYPKVQDIALYLNKMGSYPTYTFTNTTYYPNGESFFPELKEELKKAKKFIFLEFFIIEPGQAFDELFEILKQKAKEGVQVRILFDSIGSIFISSKKTIDFFKSFGIDAKIFMPFVPIFDTGLNNRDHRKIIVVDGNVAFTGGLNLTDEYMNYSKKRFDYWKDSAIKINGPAVRTFTCMFLHLWNLNNKNSEDFASQLNNFVNIDYPRFEPQGAIIPYGDDAYNKCDIAEDIYSYIISKSHHYVHIMTPYLIIDNTMLNALIFAARRGVEVSIIVPMHWDHFITFCVGRRFIKTLIKNGINIYGYNRGFIHSKMFVSDGNRGTCGSVNLDYRSFDHHFECGAFMYHTPILKDMEKDFTETLKDCTLITLEEYKKIPRFQRIVGWLFKIFAPLM